MKKPKAKKLPTLMSGKSTLGLRNKKRVAKRGGNFRNKQNR